MNKNKQGNRWKRGMKPTFLYILTLDFVIYIMLKIHKS